MKIKLEYFGVETCSAIFKLYVPNEETPKKVLNFCAFPQLVRHHDEIIFECRRGIKIGISIFSSSSTEISTSCSAKTLGTSRNFHRLCICL